jgi:hypothetical protein
MFCDGISFLKPEGIFRSTPETVQQDTVECELKNSIGHLLPTIEVLLKTSRAILCKVLHLYHYRIITVLEVLPVDLPKHLQFREWFLNALHNDDDILELSFSRMMHGFIEQIFRI